MSAKATGAAQGRRSAGFALFAECLLAGFWLVLAALPVVTALPAFAATCRHLDRHVTARRAGLREFAADLRLALRDGWRICLLWWAALGVLILDVAAARAGLPGGPPFAVVGVVGAIATVVVGLRTAASWRPNGPTWQRLARDAAHRALVRDPAGSLLLAGGLAVVAVATWQLPPLAPCVLGCLAAAALAVEGRCDPRRRMGT